ncbi:hypothetical protein SAMN05216345_1251 [Cupriavidus sp. YR651]|uniref:hypothetical protein n=1 Tax=Cupriavidus sp. YR651 TaxID=1855315 RepID=UPI0008896B79|nr:hypothetical protein [Cupriavidus sp. YR651]SDD96746.1 hypothetical protein SAMN05216345_1251 [Cupriavidus sp. YR651]
MTQPSPASARYTFRRPALAASFCTALTGEALLDARSGLFLAAPRRVGKSTFLREDLVPAAESRGWATVYVDLWSNKAQDPGELIADGIKRKIADFAGIVSKAAKAVGLTKVTVMGTLGLDVSATGLPAGVTLTQALQALRKAANKPVLLIVDEAQHALTTDKGLEAMFGLKAARDAINVSGKAPELMLVFTGSSRDKLAHLVMNSRMPFFGSLVTPFPLLDRSFTDEYTASVNQALAPSNQFEPDAVFDAFVMVGHRPEMLRHLISSIAIANESPYLSQRLREDATLIQERLWHDIESDFESLSPVQQAVVRVMASKAGQFSPFGEAAMSAYKSLLPPDATVSTATVQNAIDALREREILWKESRGTYEIEDQAWLTWLRSRDLTS